MRTLSSLASAIAVAAAFSSPAHAAEDSDERWGIAIWGLSYHVNRTVDYDEANVGLGLRYYLNRLFFVEADALRNSNHGLALPVSAGLQLKLASKAGPVPGMTLGCGRVKVNGIIVLQPSHQPFSVIVASLTILIR